MNIVGVPGWIMNFEPEYIVQLMGVGFVVAVFSLPLIWTIRKEMKESIREFKEEMKEMKEESRNTNRRLDALYYELIALRKENIKSS